MHFPILFSVGKPHTHTISMEQKCSLISENINLKSKSNILWMTVVANLDPYEYIYLFFGCIIKSNDILAIFVGTSQV